MTILNAILSHPVTLIIGVGVAVLCGSLPLLLRVPRRGGWGRVAMACLAAGAGFLLYWQALVPKLPCTPETVQALVHLQPVAMYRDGEISGIEIGQRVQFRLIARPGWLPITRVTALLPVVTHDGHTAMDTVELHALDGARTFENDEPYLIRPGKVYPLPEGGEVRNMLVVLRNSWGLENTVILPLRILPESLRNRTA